MTFPSSTSGSSTNRELGAGDLELQACKHKRYQNRAPCFSKNSAGVMMVSDFLVLEVDTVFNFICAESLASRFASVEPAPPDLRQCLIYSLAHKTGSSGP